LLDLLSAEGTSFGRRGRTLLRRCCFRRILPEARPGGCDRLPSLGVPGFCLVPPTAPIGPSTVKRVPVSSVRFVAGRESLGRHLQTLGAKVAVSIRATNRRQKVIRPTAVDISASRERPRTAVAQYEARAIRLGGPLTVASLTPSTQVRAVVQAVGLLATGVSCDPGSVLAEGLDHLRCRRMTPDRRSSCSSSAASPLAPER
jgi:hypothetical protein